MPLPRAGLGVRVDPGWVCRPPTNPAGTPPPKNLRTEKDTVVRGSSYQRCTPPPASVGTAAARREATACCNLPGDTHANHPHLPCTNACTHAQHPPNQPDPHTSRTVTRPQIHVHNPTSQTTRHHLLNPVAGEDWWRPRCRLRSPPPAASSSCHSQPGDKEVEPRRWRQFIPAGPPAAHTRRAPK